MLDASIEPTSAVTGRYARVGARLAVNHAACLRDGVPDLAS